MENRSILIMSIIGMPFEENLKKSNFLICQFYLFAKLPRPDSK